MYIELTNPNHVLRFCDELTASENNKAGSPVNAWGGCIPMFRDLVGKTIREVEEEYGGDGFWYRCRAEDAPDHWLGCLTAEYLGRTGETVGRNPWARCRGRVEDKPTKKTRVRLWLVGNLVVSSPDSPCDTAVELHLDSEGFFHEG